MTALKISNFGGVLPRVPPRVLPANGAQINENLLATAVEFRPLLGDKDIDAAPAGALTLYRMTRNPDGALRTVDDGGWIAELRDKSYVAGQLNDDATERTVVAFNDGKDGPRVVDVKGTDRLLGVPAPKSISVTANITDEFTAEEARTWLSDTVLPALTEALLSVLYEDVIESRYYKGKPVAGSTIPFDTPDFQIKFNGEVPWMGYITLSLTDADKLGLTAPELEGWSYGPWTWNINIELMPFWGVVRDLEKLKTSLRAIEHPLTGEQVLSDSHVDMLAPKLASLFDPDGPSLAAQRKQMDDAAKAFLKVIFDTKNDDPGPRPEEPKRPTVPEYLWLDGIRDPAWVQYDKDMADWREELDKWTKANKEFDNRRTGVAAVVKQNRITAMNVSNAIEEEYFRRKDNIRTLIEQMLNNEQLVGGEGSGALITVDPDRIIDTRFYVVTYVDDWGWESAPSPVSEMLEIDQNDSATINLQEEPPAGRGIVKWRLYRSNVGSVTAVFQFVDEMLITTLSYTDTVPGEKLGEPCPTFGWSEPPVRLDQASASPEPPPRGVDPYLRGAVAMPNGIVAGFLDNFVAFCHPYYPYAWPVEYQITTEHPIVGLGVFGQTLFVGTLGYPYFITGADSASMAAEKRPEPQPCVSRRSIASASGGVLYASPDGICYASPAGVQVVTSELFAREDWQALDPSSIYGIVYEEVYYFWAGGACWALDFTAKKLACVSGLEQATALHRDVLTDGLFAVVGDRVKRLFAEGRRTGAWKTPLVTLPQQAPLAWVQVDGDQSAANPVTLNWWGDGKLRHTATITDIKPKRLPAGRWLEHEVGIESRARVTKVLMTSSTSELQGA